MATITVTNHLSLDGVMESPEDWASRNHDEVMGRKLGEGMASPGGLLFGRRTYEQFYSYWPAQEDNPITDVLNRKRKYVVSRTLSEPLPWANSTLVGDVGELNARTDDDLVVLGSGDLLQTLMRDGLVDEYLLMIHPVVLGSGRRMFPEGSAPQDLRLVDSLTTTTGVVMATYRKERR